MNRTIPQLLIELSGGRRGRPALRYKAEGSWRTIAWEGVGRTTCAFSRGACWRSG